MASLATILRLDKTNKKEESPIYFRIIKPDNKILSTPLPYPIHSRNPN